MNVSAKFQLPKFGTQAVKLAKKAPAQAKTAAKKAVGTVQKKVNNAARSVGGTQRSGGVGYRKSSGDTLWLPNTTRPEWLDGSLPGAPSHHAAGCLVRGPGRRTGP